MAEYRVTYEIDLAADSPEAAAREAWSIIRGQMTLAGALPAVFAVQRAGDSLGHTELIELACDGRARRLPGPTTLGERRANRPQSIRRQRLV